MSLSSVMTAQRQWARSVWAGHSGPKAPSVSENLFQPLSQVTHSEFANADGDELGLTGRRPKMQSLRSSSALACNVFDAWRGTNLAPLASALGLKDSITEFRFECRCPHGLSTLPPNLDLLLYTSTGSPIGVESKFTEPYGPHRPSQPLKAKYFSGPTRRWETQGLPRCQALAEAIGKSETFSRLDAGQLAKHLLGLAHLTADRTPPRLLYLWFDAGGSEAEEHREELDRFAKEIDPGVSFSARTYQEVFRTLSRGPEPKPGYFKYLETRYFPS